MDNQTAIDYKLHEAEAKGKQEGMEQGKEEEKYLIAKKMLAAGADPNFIASVTGLSIEVIRKLQEN